MIPLIPQFIEKQEEKTGAARGTAYHAVMECMDFGKDMETEEQAGQTLEELAGSGRLERQDIDAVNVRDLLKFIQSPLGNGCRTPPAGEIFTGSSRLSSDCPETRWTAPTRKNWY